MPVINPVKLLSSVGTAPVMSLTSSIKHDSGPLLTRGSRTRVHRFSWGGNAYKQRERFFVACASNARNLSGWLPA